MTQTDALHSTVLENTSFFVSVSCQESAESAAGKIPVFNLLCLGAFQQTHGSAGKAFMFILIFAFNSLSKISSRCAQRH